MSSDDPIRVFQEFSTVDLLSGGRAEIMVGRGSFIESFPLFGYDLRDYDALFAEKLELLLHIRETGATPAGHEVLPRPLQDPLPVWVAVGGTPESAVRAGALEPPDGARHHRRSPGAVRAVRRAAPAGGAIRQGTRSRASSINSHGYIAESRSARSTSPSRTCPKR